MGDLAKISHSFFSFSGRMRRRDFWICSLVLWAINFIAYLTLFVVTGARYVASARSSADSNRSGAEQVAAANEMGLLIAIGVLAISVLTLWPNLAVNGKRLHDRGRSAGVNVVFYLPLALMFVPYFGQFLYYAALFAVTIYWLIDLGILDGKPGGNMYGPSPKLSAFRNAEEVFA